MQGKTINGFTLQRLLGRGGMAEVWYAENEIHKPAAVKLLNADLSHNAQIVERFRNEAEIMVKLNHPNIRQVYGYGTIDDRPAIVMEYLEGDDLKARMKRGQRFSDEELKKWWDQLVDALNYPHKKGIVHRDIKPGNIFVDGEGNIKLLDFGIAKVRESISSTQTGQKLGTLMYMSPEQVKDSKHIDYRTDLYSLAVTFVHLITGKKPYNSDTTSDFEISEQIVYQPLDLSGLPEGWRMFLRPYLSKSPEQRPALRAYEESNSDFSSNMEESVDEETIVSEGPRKPKPKKLEPKNSEQKKTEPKVKERSIPKTNNDKPKSKKGLWIGLGFSVVAVAMMLFLMMGNKVSDESVDFLLLQDVSGTMLARDFEPDRLEASKEVIAHFMENHPNDRFGLVVFAGESSVQEPLNSDHAVILNRLNGMKSGMITDGTAIGDGLETAINCLKESNATSKVIILLTDGVNNCGSIGPATAAEMAKPYGIRIYTIGIGAYGTAPYPELTLHGTQLQMMEVEIDEQLLQNIANNTGGKYFRASSNQKLGEIFNEIGLLEHSKHCTEAQGDVVENKTDGPSVIQAENTDPGILVSAKRRVSVGEQFELSFKVSLDADVEGKDFSGPDFVGFTVIGGPFNSSSSSVQIVNGTMSRKLNNTYSYMLKAEKEGCFTIGPASLIVDGKELKSEPYQISVVDDANIPDGSKVHIDDQDLFMKVVPSKTMVYVGEPVELTYKLYTRIPVSDLSCLQVPYFEGFRIKDKSDDSGVMYQETETLNGIEYTTAVIKKVELTPLKTGEITIDPMRVECVGQVYVGNDSKESTSQSSGDPFEALFADSPFFSSNYIDVRTVINAPSITFDVKSR